MAERRIAITDGTDITEPYTDSNEQTIPYTTEAKGVGALHVYTVKGEDGAKVTRTGNESGITVDMTSKEPVTEIIQYYNADTHGDKVAAITIDDGLGILTLKPFSIFSKITMRMLRSIPLVIRLRATQTLLSVHTMRATRLQRILGITQLVQGRV